MSTKEIERDLRSVARLIRRSGVTVRRENLARGHSYRVKSGDCQFFGQNLIFVDRRLPVAQQLSLLMDYVIDLGLNVGSDDLQQLSPPNRALLKNRLADEQRV